MSNQQVVQSRGIYHGLPVYPKELKGLTAIITGANGISGNYMLRVLAEAPERWTKIYCLSRRPPAIPDGLPANAEHIALDFLQPPEEIAKVLRDKNIKNVDYIFFYSYIQPPPKPGQSIWSDAEELCRVNASLLSNFLHSLPLTPLHPTRILLQTGAKYYGIHLGPTTTPSHEHHPRIPLAPNFYYTQEDLLTTFCTTHPPTTHSIAMPSYILGAVPDAAMNLLFPIGVYASVCKYTGGVMEFPSDLRAWERVVGCSSARLNGYLEEWVALSEGGAGERVNVVDGGSWGWGVGWEGLSQWAGVGCGTPSLDEGEYGVVVRTGEDTPRGWGPPDTYRMRFTLTEWAKRKEVQEAWEALIAQHGLKVDKLQDMDVDRIFGFADGSLMGGTLDLSMNKARKMGWHGFVDTNECIREVLDEFVALGMLPPGGGGKVKDQ
ncbi:NAD dependent epimerase/dehydratase family protein-like protein [Polyplosphaeria fusca]|uniref:NAD dependent epimerase/dehydratase family protein-like protein n=1 Tax=Polyplosphaeria fusca TaxID=682080 RepID=A0A9P4QX50_9PLEO|nr:NAD dependent epimerase/dehydratase family protein-like protein [Polyplosphaeria fusca]